MDKFPEQIGFNIRRLRKERGLSLNNVAETTGVSKAMIGQIERGESNPTVAVLWKIANGLKVSFTSLLKNEDLPITFVHYKNVQPVLEDDGRYIVYPIFPFEPTKKLESYRVELEPDCYYENEGHQEGVEEYLTILSGKMELELDGQQFSLSEGSSLHFYGHKPHIYKNTHGEKAVCQMVIYYRD
ncbi:helix-turn-helix domain-containing protein [Rossellomorea sp. BNER]|uniref:helix-turn-helix domain-containing protein n=1 Tax=Rossellomorea sp. BNER TaxID=2962031 RepID=UPI003AF21D33